MSKYKIRVSFICILSICIFQYACTKLENTNMTPSARGESIEVEDDDPDEIGYAVEDDFELEERASTFKIVQVVTNDSLPIYRPDGSGKKQKYAKRQIVSTSAKTRFTLRGYGFKSQVPDTSKVVAYIKNVEQPNVEIVSWSDTVVVVDFPILESALLINNTFSIKFKLWRANDIKGRTNLSRTKSKSCISDVKAELALGGTAGNCVPTSEAQSKQKITTKLLELGKSSFPVTQSTVSLSWIPTIGDVILFKKEDSLTAFDFYGVVTTAKDANGIFTVYSPSFLSNQFCAQTVAAFKGCEVKLDNTTQKYVIKGLNGFDPYIYLR